MVQGGRGVLGRVLEAVLVGHPGVGLGALQEVVLGARRGVVLGGLREGPMMGRPRMGLLQTAPLQGRPRKQAASCARAAF